MGEIGYEAGYGSVDGTTEGEPSLCDASTSWIYGPKMTKIEAAKITMGSVELAEEGTVLNINSPVSVAGHYLPYLHKLTYLS